MIPRTMLPFLLLSLMVLGAAKPTCAITWVGAGTGGKTATDPSDSTTRWNVKSNWDANRVPAGAEAFILIPLSNEGCVYAPPGIFSLQTKVTINGTSDNGCFVVSPGCSFQPVATLTVGDTAKGRLVQTGGSVTVPTTSLLCIAPHAGSTGTYDLENGTVSAYEIDVGYRTGPDGGTGLFRQRGGAVTATTMRLGGGPGQGTYELDNGSLSAAITVRGGTCVSSFVQKGGT
jgi:hypothetical protein